ncbi:UNVERIFIED_CONTAM: hypothetical protein GTU68_055300 [Idotea baltica]|nr:hypothetical protein [Idotea baltica]
MVCLVCAIVVSSAAVALKPMQDTNIERDRQMNILAAAGLLDPDLSIEEQFESVQTFVVDLRTGEYTDDVDPASFSDLETDDIAKIGRREDYSVVYLIDDENGNLDKVILPVRGYGLWSTMQGFVALENDLNTVAGIGFFAHGETPGLGGEIDNPSWKAIWPGKEVYRDGVETLSVIKGVVPASSANAEYQIDGLAGATLTTKGVDNLVKFWLGEEGFRPYLEKLAAGEA